MRKVDPPHLPRRHLAKVAEVGVAVALDREDRRVVGEPRRGVQSLIVAPQARRQRDVPRLVPLVVHKVALAVLGRLPAEQLRRAAVVAEEPNVDAARRVAVAARVEQPVQVMDGPSENCAGIAPNCAALRGGAHRFDEMFQ